MSSNEKKYKRFFNLPFLRIYRKKLKSLLFLLPAENNNFLDVGCGEGFVMKFIKNENPSATLVGIDIDPEAIEKASAKVPSALFKIGQAEDLPFSKKSFDLVLCLEVLEHSLNPQLILKELFRVSRKSVIISVPREPFFSFGSLLAGRYLNSWGKHPQHLHFWTKKQIIALVEKYGKIRIVKSACFWTLILAEYE